MGFIATMRLGSVGAVVGLLVFTGLLGVGDNQMFDLGGLVGVIISRSLYRALLKNKERPLVR